eukprot:5144080-Amphidinium_carterae.1
MVFPGTQAFQAVWYNGCAIQVKSVFQWQFSYHLLKIPSASHTLRMCPWLDRGLQDSSADAPSLDEKHN